MGENCRTPAAIYDRVPPLVVPLGPALGMSSLAMSPSTWSRVQRRVSRGRPVGSVQGVPKGAVYPNRTLTPMVNSCWRGISLKENVSGRVAPAWAVPMRQSASKA